MSGGGAVHVHLQPEAWLPAQAEAARLAEDPHGPEYVLLSGGQGAGKTWWLCWEGLRLYFLALQWAMAHGVAPREIHALLLAPTLNLLKKTSLPTLESVLERAGLQGRYTINRQDGILRFDWGGELYLCTAEKPEMIIGFSVVVAMVDEPGTPKDGEGLRRVRGRLRGPSPRRVCVMAGTPEDIVSREHFYSFIASPEAQLKYGEQGDNTRRIVFASTRANHFIHDLEGYIRGQQSVLTQQQQEAYLEGRFVAFNLGRVYSGFIDRPYENGGHMVRRADELLKPPAAGNDLIIGLDFNVNPMCGVVAWQVGTTILIADEIRIPNAGGEGTTPITRWCEEFVRRWIGPEASRIPDGWKGAVCVHGDATEKRQTVAASTTGWKLLHDHLRPLVEARGWDYRNGVPMSNPREIDRVNSVNAGFENRRLLIAEDCVHLRKDLNLVGWKEGTNQVDKDADKNLTHLSDAFGYLWTQRTGLMPQRRADERMPDVVTVELPAFGETVDWGTGGGG